MISLTGSQTNWNSYPDDEKKKILQNFGEWVAKLRRNDQFIYGSSLSTNVKVLTKTGTGIRVDGPFPESKELLTGFFMIKAESFEAAMEIAQTNPGLAIGEVVTLAEV